MLLETKHVLGMFNRCLVPAPARHVFVKWHVPCMPKIRLVVDGLPWRQSATSISRGGSHGAFVDTVQGHLVMAFGAGNHSVWLQWKKPWGGSIASWRNLPSAHDGYAGGRSIVITAQVRIEMRVGNSRTFFPLGVGRILSIPSRYWFKTGLHVCLPY